jgi:hypothetical protein
LANYFHVVVIGLAHSWLMNLPKGTLTSWQELCHQFMANFECAYSCLSNETDLHAVQQRPEEPLHSFIQRFSHVRNSIPHISNASSVVAFHQDVRDKKMLEKLTSHDIQDVTEFINLADKCVRATESRAWYVPLALEVGKEGKPDAEITA